jgi:hypothetical protein
VLAVHDYGPCVDDVSAWSAFGTSIVGHSPPGSKFATLKDDCLRYVDHKPLLKRFGWGSYRKVAGSEPCQGLSFNTFSITCSIKQCPSRRIRSTRLEKISHQVRKSVPAADAATIAIMDKGSILISQLMVKILICYNQTILPNEKHELRNSLSSGM